MITVRTYTSQSGWQGILADYNGEMMRFLAPHSEAIQAFKRMDETHIGARVTLSDAQFSALFQSCYYAGDNATAISQWIDGVL